MTTMLETVARAIYEAEPYHEAFNLGEHAVITWAELEGRYPSRRAYFLKAARAALESLKTPDAAMIEAGEDAFRDKISPYGEVELNAAAHVWTAMVSAILAERTDA